MALNVIRAAGRYLRLHRQVRRAASGRAVPVIVFQMGKVASSTIEATLAEVPGVQVFRAHRLDEKGKRASRRALERRLVTGKIIQARLPARVVTLVREPIGRNISAYFQNMDELWGTRNTAQKFSIEELIRGFLEKFDHARALKWFDVQFKPALGIDVYEYSFPREEGFQRIQSGPYDVLILQAGLADEVKARELARLVGVDHLSLVQKNVGEQKSYSAVYRRFVDSARLPESYVNEMLDSRFAQHFFGSEELAAVRQRWLRKSPGESARS